jgi:hypothetical protein
LEPNVPFSLLKTQTGRQYFFQKLTQLSQGNSVLDSPSSNINDFPSRDTCVSIIQLKSPICNKKWDSDVENSVRQAICLPKANSILTGKQGARCSCF